MLFKQRILGRIAAGEVTVAFRRWRRPTVKTGGRLRTPIGELAIRVVEATTLEDVTDTDARAAGFADRAEALAALAAGDGQLYRIEFRLDREDPRKGLALNDVLDVQAVGLIRDTLRELDRRGRGPRWTDTYLRLVHQHSGIPAGELARMAGAEKAVLKRRMRRLKDLGLTESLEVGYRLSPRGRRFVCGPSISRKRDNAPRLAAEQPAVRKALAEDVEVLAQIWMEDWNDAHDELLPPELSRLRTLLGFRQRLIDGLGMTIVVLEKGRPVGFAMIKQDELDQLYVARNTRGTGAARRLVSAALDQIRQAGHCRAWLACAIGNHRAARFYEKAGWTLAGIVTIRLDTPGGPVPLDVWRYQIAI